MNYITAMMNPAEEAELDCILAGADYTECDEVSEQPGPSPALIGAVTTPTMDAISAEGMAPRKRREGITLVGGGSCQGPSLSLSQ